MSTLRVLSASSSLTLMTIRWESTWSTTPPRRATMVETESRATTSSMPVPTSWRLGADQRHGLTLHVRAHQGAVGIVVLEEGNEGGGDRHQLLGRHVHHVDIGRFRHDEFAVPAARHKLVGETTVLGEPSIGLGNGVQAFLHRRQVLDPVGPPGARRQPAPPCGRDSR